MCLTSVTANQGYITFVQILVFCFIDIYIYIKKKEVDYELKSFHSLLFFLQFQSNLTLKKK